MTERLLSETVTEYPRLKMRESEIIKVAGQRAHSVGTVVSVIFCGIFLMWAMVAWVYDVRRFGGVDGFFFVFWVTVTSTVTFASYKVAFHWSRVAEIDKQTEWVNAPVREVTKEYIEEETAVLNYAEHNTSDMVIVDNEPMTRREPDYECGDGVLSGDIIHQFRLRFIEQDYKVNRALWRTFAEHVPGEPIDEHYSFWMRVLKGKKYIDNRNEWTDEGLLHVFGIPLPSDVYDNDE